MRSSDDVPQIPYVIERVVGFLILPRLTVKKFLEAQKFRLLNSAVIAIQLDLRRTTKWPPVEEHLTGKSSCPRVCSPVDFTSIID